MLGQTFSLIDIPRLVTLIFMEGALSVDNALAIALIVRGLQKTEKQRALFIGVISALLLRALGILCALYLLELFWAQIFGGLYLLYLCIKHLISKVQKRSSAPLPIKRKFWKTVALVELTDTVFAIDSILAGIALIGIVFHPPTLPPKIWIVYVGGIIGLILMRFAAGMISSLLSRFPKLETSAHLVIGWVGLKLIGEALIKGVGKEPYIGLPIWSEVLFWIGIVLSATWGLAWKKR